MSDRERKLKAKTEYFGEKKEKAKERRGIKS